MEIKDELMSAPHPAWTAVGVERLFGETALVEVAVIAVIQD